MKVQENHAKLGFSITTTIGYKIIRAFQRPTVDGISTPPNINTNLRNMINSLRSHSQIFSSRWWSFVAITYAVLAFLVCTATAAVSEYTQVLPSAPEVANGALQVNTTPGGIGGWRFIGEHLWRTPGTPVGGLTIHPREIEFKPVTGYYQPVRSTLTINSGGVTTAYQGDYAEVGAAANGGITVQLKPNSLAGAQWRILGDALWRNSGTSVTGLIAGTYLVESKPVAGRTTPHPLVANVSDGQVATVSPTYYLADAVAGTTPSVLPFATVTDQTMPYQFVGQFRTDLGSGTGFVVTKPISNIVDPNLDPTNLDPSIGSRVVATAAHLVFDYDGLTVAGNQQWLFQRDSASYEPVPRTPHGYYVFTGYSAARSGEPPGTSSSASQVLDVAALYFTDSDAAPGGGASGFLASDNVVNEWLTGSNSKILVGYPVDGISASNQGRMFATSPVTASFNAASSGGGNHPVTYTTSALSSVGGNSGGPLCVRVTDPNDGLLKYYPAAIFLGGTGPTMVRVIDTDVLVMLYTAQRAGEDGNAHVGGGVSQADSPSPTTGTFQGALTVNISQPAGARWGLSPGSYLYTSGHTQAGSVGTYNVYFQPVSGWTTPASRTVTVSANQTTPVTQSYVVAATGSLQVSISPAGAVSAGAQWQVDGGAFLGSETTVNGLSVGSHTVAFSTVSSWATPLSQIVTVNANQTTGATGIYSPVGTSSYAQMTSPANGSALGSSSATLAWSSGTGATAYALYVGSSPGAYDIYAKAEGGSLSDTVSNLPGDGRTLYVTLWSYMNGQWVPRSYYYTAVDNRAQMTSPVNGSALGSPSATFTWSAGTGAGAYALYVGSGPGAYDLYAKAEGVGLTDTVNNLPVDGRTIYVTLWSFINGKYVPNSYTYTARDNRAQMTSPANGSALGSSSVSFTWSAGTGATAYALYVGSAPGVFDIYAKAEGASLADTVNIPSGAINGHTIYVRLYSFINGAWVFNSYVYTASDTKAQMTSPAVGTPLASASATLSWSAGTGVSAYALYVGSSPGVFDIYAKAEGSSLSDTVSNLPLDGRRIYVRLYSLTSSGWKFNAYTYDAFTSSGGPLALLTSPTDGSTFTSATSAFAWTAGIGASAYALYVGNTPGAYDIYAKAEGANQSDTVTTLPQDGSPVYVTLWSFISGQWQGTKSHYSTAAQGISPKGLLTGPSPANGSKLTAGQLALNWSAAASQGTQYALYVGSAPLTADIYAKAEGSSLSDTVQVPVDGRRLFVTLWTLINGVWKPTSYYYDTTE